MPGALIVVLLLGASALGIRGVTRFLGRPMPGAVLAAFFVLGGLPFAESFLPERTALPLDAIPLTTPWLPLGKGLPYNAWLSDVTSQMLPWTQAVRAAWRGGDLPLRDRWNGCGTPLAANSQSAAFSPFTLPSLVLPLPSAFLLVTVLKLALAMAGMWLWAGELGVSRGAATFAGVSFGLSMTFTQWAFFPQTAVFCLWPWTLFALELLRDPVRRRRAFAALVVVLAAASLAGHPESAALGVLFTALWIAGRRVAGDLPAAGHLAPRFLAAGLLAAGTTAFLILPTLYAIRASNRLVLAAEPYWAPHLSVVPHGPVGRAWLTGFFPYALGDLIHGRVLPGATGAVPEMDLAYFGIIGWAAALLVFRPGSRRPRAGFVLAGLLLAGLGAAWGAWPFAELFSFVPGIRHMFPLRFASWAALAGPMIGALELDRLARDASRSPRAALGALVVPIGLAAFALVVHARLRPEHAASGDVLFQRTETKVAVAALASAGILLVLTRWRPAAAIAGIAALAAGELLFQWHDQYRFVSTGLFYPETPMIAFLRSIPGPYRVAGIDTAIFPNVGVFAGVEDVRTHDAIERRDYVTFLDATAGYDPTAYFKRIGRPNASVLDFLNVRFLIGAPQAPPPGPRWKLAYSGADGLVYENGDVLPRAFSPRTVRLVAAAGDATEPVRDANALFGSALAEIAANEDWRERAWVLWSSDGLAATDEARIDDYRESVNAIEFRARVERGPACAIVSVVQDGGWSARDARGVRLDVRRANGPFLAIVLPRGESDVRLRYRPPGFVPGAAVSLVTFATAVGLVGLRRRSGFSGARP